MTNPLLKPGDVDWSCQASPYLSRIFRRLWLTDESNQRQPGKHQGVGFQFGNRHCDHLSHIGCLRPFLE